MKIRKPAVAGMFYPKDKQRLKLLINKLFSEQQSYITDKYITNNILGGIVPHAGYKYSGPEAVHFFEILRQSNQNFETVIIINPNHTGYGENISLDNNNFWETPLGRLEIDNNLAKYCGFSKSSEAHIKEHSGEVILPFLQYFINSNFKILPITMSSQTIETAINIAQNLYNAVSITKRKIIIIASTDFSHFINPEEGRKIDMVLINKIENLESRKLIKQVISENISMCGFGPVATLIEYIKLSSAKPKIKLLKFGNSSNVSNYKSVVDYASLIAYE